MRHTPRWTTTLVIVLLMMWIGCADHCGELAYRNVVHERTKVFAFSVTTEVLWRTTRDVLSEKGAKFDDAIPLTAEVLSPWRGKPGHRNRYGVRIIESKDGNFVEVQRTVEREIDIYPDTGPTDVARKPIGQKIETTVERDLETEWTIVQKLDPAAAVEIKAAAQKRSDEVHDVVASGCQ